MEIVYEDAVKRKDYVLKVEERDPAKFLIPPYYKRFIKSVVVDEDEIEQRAAVLAEQIADYYKDRPYYMLVTLKGAVDTYAIVAKYLKRIYGSGKYNNCIRPEYIRAKSYQNTGTTGVVTLNQTSDSFSVKDKEILIVEDIVDTGTTIRKLHEKMLEDGAKSIKILTMTIKEDLKDINVDFIGFKVPNAFLVGFGLDYNECMRDLSCIAVINEEGIEAFKL